MTNREFFLQCRSVDVPLFVRVFNAVPADKLDWRPEPKARTARELIGHLIGHEQDVVELASSTPGPARHWAIGRRRIYSRTLLH